MQCYDTRLINQIIDGCKSATVRRVENGVGTDAFNTALHVGQIYEVYDSKEQPRVAVRLSAEKKRSTASSLARMPS